MEAKNTAGPWVANQMLSGRFGWRIESDAKGYPNDGWVIAAEIFGPDAEANARLIAAAPELLEAAIYAVAQMAEGEDPDIDDDGEEIEPFERLRNAIAKALGQ